MIDVIEDLAPWLLDKPIKEVKHEENVELPISNIRSDQVFRVVLADGKEIILHVEFEAKDDVEVMRLRMLHYMTRFVEKFNIEVQSVVLYIGGKGKGDTGTHKYGNLAWQYRVIRLQEVKARELLNMNKLSFMPLIGLTKSEKPEKDYIEAIEVIKKNSKGRFRKQLLTLLVELIPDERLMEMVETHLEKDDWLLNMPFLRKIRGQAHEEGREEGHEEGHEEGREEVAKNMKREEMSVEIIAKLTGLSIEEVEKL